MRLSYEEGMMSQNTDAIEDKQAQTKKPAFAGHFATWAEYIGVGGFTFVLTMFIYNLWGASFTTPWVRSGDSSLPLLMVKELDKGNWIYGLDQLGAPGHGTVHDLPQSGENLQWLIMKIFTFFTNAPGALNFYYLLTYVVAAMVAYGAAKWWGLRRPTSLVVAVLYATLSYHFFRNEMHLLLSLYAFIPLVIVYCYKSVNGKVELPKWKWVLFVIVAASAKSYYTFFAFLLVATAIVYNFIRRNRDNIKQQFIVLGSMMFVYALNLAPDILYMLKNGRNSEITRKFDDAEVYGLQITNMFFPRVNHRIPLLRRAAQAVSDAGIPSENTQALGIIAALGVVALVGYGFYQLIRSEKIIEQAHYFFVLLVVVVLVTVSSGPTLIAGMAHFEYIRSWNRVTVIIAFIGLLFAGWLFEQYAEKKNLWSKNVALILLITILVVGVLDQTSPLDRFSIEGVKYQQDNECTFISKVKDEHPENLQAFTLPYTAFPENGASFKLGAYDQALATLCDKDLRVSFGATRGRNDSFQKNLAKKYLCITEKECRPAGESLRDDLDVLRKNGFSLLFVYRAGYPDNGDHIQAELTRVLGPPIENADTPIFAYVIDK